MIYLLMNVIIIMMVNLIVVKSTCVLLMLKISGEINTAQWENMSIVTVHGLKSLLPLVLDLLKKVKFKTVTILVKNSMISLLKLWLPGTKIPMVPLMKMMVGPKLIWPILLNTVTIPTMDLLTVVNSTNVSLIGTMI